MCFNCRNPSLCKNFLQCMWEFSLCWDAAGPKSSLLHSEGMRFFRAANVRTRETRWKTTTWKPFHLLSSISIMLIHTETMLPYWWHCTYWRSQALTVLSLWQDLGITSDLFASPISPHACAHLSSSPFWSPSLSLLPSSLFSANPTVTEALLIHKWFYSKITKEIIIWLQHVMETKDLCNTYWKMLAGVQMSVSFIPLLAQSWAHLTLPCNKPPMSSVCCQWCAWFLKLGKLIVNINHEVVTPSLGQEVPGCEFKKIIVKILAILNSNYVVQRLKAGLQLMG